jgi:uncharacterized Zn finger protein (UPF0148 family)
MNVDMRVITGTTYCPECGHHHPIIQAEDGHRFTLCDYQTAESWPDVSDVSIPSREDVYRRMESETPSRADVWREFNTMRLLKSRSIGTKYWTTLHMAYPEMFD